MILAPLFYPECSRACKLGTGIVYGVGLFVQHYDYVSVVGTKPNCIFGAVGGWVGEGYGKCSQESRSGDLKNVKQ